MIIYAKIRRSIDYTDFILLNVHPAEECAERDTRVAGRSGGNGWKRARCGSLWRERFRAAE